MKGIIFLIVLIALAIGTYMNRSENRSAVTEDTIQSFMAAPVRKEIQAMDKPQLEVPISTEMPL